MRSWLRLIVRPILQLSRCRRIADGIAKRHRLRDLNRTRSVADRASNWPTLIIRSIDVWSDEEQDFAALTCRQFSFEEIANDGD